MDKLWLVFLSFLCTPCYRDEYSFLDRIYRGYHLDFISMVLGFRELLTENRPLNNNNNSILLL